MKKPLFLAAALLLFAFYNYGLYQWVQSGYGFAHVWQSIRADWLLTITVVDTGVFSLLGLAWLCADAKRRRWPLWRRALLAVTTLVFGVVVLLLYLAFRNVAAAETKKQ